MYDEYARQFLVLVWPMNTHVNYSSYSAAVAQQVDEPDNCLLAIHRWPLV